MKRARDSCSPTTRRWSRRSSSGCFPSTWAWRGPRRIPRTRPRRSGIDVEPFYLDQDDIDPQNGQQSLFDFKFAVSYGDPQEVRVLAKRSLGNVTLNYQVDGGAVQTGVDERVERR